LIAEMPAPPLTESWGDHVASSAAFSGDTQTKQVELEADTQALADLQRAVANVFAVHTRNAQRIRKEAQNLEETRMVLERERQRLKQEVEEAKEAAMKEVEAERAHLADVWKDLTAALEKEKAAMGSHPQGKVGPKVKLDVGGHVCTTSKGTLTAEPGSLLARMFDGTLPLETEEDGSVFIDRDGRHFHHVLNYLRDRAAFAPPLDANESSELLKEAQFYQLQGLCDALSGSASSGRRSSISEGVATSTPLRQSSINPGSALKASTNRASPVELAQHDLLFKILLLGDSQVGKSNILLRFTKDDFQADSKPTMGVEFGAQTMEVDGQLVKAQLWDLAGEERFRGNAAQMYRGAVGALVVFDLSDPKSLESVAKYWIPELKKCADPSLVPILIGHKCDLPSRTVSEEEAKKVAEEHSMSYIEASALKGDGVHDAFRTVLSEIYHYRRLMAQAQED